MKIALILLAFAMTLALTSRSVAEEAPKNGEAVKNSEGALHTEKASDHQSAEHGAEHKGGHGGGHGALSEKMNQLFPQPQPKVDVSAVPEKPELSSPAYFSKIAGDKATLQWKPVTGANEYHVQVATDPNFKWLVANEYHVTATTFDATGLEAGKHYYWRVAAVKSGNWSTFRRSFFAVSMFETPAAATK